MKKLVVNNMNYPKFKCQDCGNMIQLDFDPTSREERRKGGHNRQSSPSKSLRLKDIKCGNCNIEDDKCLEWRRPMM